MGQVLKLIFFSLTKDSTSAGGGKILVLHSISFEKIQATGRALLSEYGTAPIRNHPFQDSNPDPSDTHYAPDMTFTRWLFPDGVMRRPRDNRNWSSIEEVILHFIGSRHGGPLGTRLGWWAAMSAQVLYNTHFISVI